MITSNDPDRKTENPFKNISRRDLFRLAKTFGWSTILLSSTSLSGNVSLVRLAQAAELEQKKRTAKKTRVSLTYGTAIFNKDAELVDPVGCSQFLRDIEERTDGEIRVELIDQNRICKQEDCARKAREGIIDLYSATTQNSADVEEYFNVLDFPYLFPSRAAQNYFFYHPDSEKLFREPVRKHHGMRFLFTNCRLRSIIMGLAWREKPAIGSIEELAGLKIRISGSKPGKIALSLLNISPIAIPWIDTLGAIKHGMVDGIEAYDAGVALAMPGAISQVIDLRLFSGNWHTAINEKVFEKLTPDLQNALMESAYQTQVFIQLASEAALVNTVGASNPQTPNTVFGKHGIRFVELPERELKKAEHLCSPEFNPKPWEGWREKLNKMAGNIDIYKEIHAIARQIPSDSLAENVEPRRWWKAL